MSRTLTLPITISWRLLLPTRSYAPLVFFFFQAEDGIRDDLVTGVQTCALPISWRSRNAATASGSDVVSARTRKNGIDVSWHATTVFTGPKRRARNGAARNATITRSEERRVGKECRSRWSPYH